LKKFLKNFQIFDFLKILKFQKILKLYFENFSKILKQDAQMHRKTRCPDVTGDAQMPNEMPRSPTRCPDVTGDAQMPNEMPRRRTRCPDVKRDAR